MNEDDGIVTVCLELELSSPVGRPITANITSSDSSAIGIMLTKSTVIIMLGIQLSREMVN